MTPQDIETLQKHLGYHFRDAQLLIEALTHPSHRDASKHRHDFERLEFLGDSVLGMLVAEILFEAFPHEREGDLAKRKAALVSRDALVQVANTWEISPMLRYSERNRGGAGKKQASVLENACEAIIGALFLDGGFIPTRALVRKVWTPLAREVAAPPKDPKTTLQEWAQGRGFPLPVYIEQSSHGSAHAPLFVIEVRVNGVPHARGEGATKKAASAAAAAAMLLWISEHAE
jgi:ribonuclease-3